MSFRSALLLSMIGLVVGVAAAIAVAVGIVVERDARDQLAQDVTRSHAVVERAWSSARALEAAQSRVIAEEPRLKATVATHDISHETVVGVAQEMNRGLHADLLLIGDADGVLLADAAHPEEEGEDLLIIPMVGAALSTGEASGTVAEDDGLYRASARTIAFGETRVGVLVLGYRMDDAFARSIESQTGLAFLANVGNRVICRSQSAHAEVAGLQLGRTPSEITLGGEQYLASAGILDPRPGAEPLRYVVLASLDRALAPSRQLVRLLYVLTGIALLIGIVLALLLSGALSRPLGRLVAFAGRIAAGDLDARARPEGLRELRVLGGALDAMGVALRSSREALADKQRLEKELEIASRLQTALLPRTPNAPGLEIAAQMRTATEVGGDFYDVIAGDSVSWLAIGDVAGHGLRAGIVMLMVRTGLAALVQRDPNATVSQLIVRLNGIVHEGVQERLGSHEHVTFCALRHEGEGRFRYAGAHEDILVWRAASGACDRIATRGTWLGVVESIERVTVESELRLGLGDVMVLMTDGAFEGERKNGKMLGLDALCSAIETMTDIELASAQAVLDHLSAFIEREVPVRQDDQTLVVVKRAQA